jgi:peptidoglycan/xylan/chitin deacetylase (PgdA/CDA1 family)
MNRYLKFIKRTWASFSFRKNILIRLEQPVISFTFDDAPGSAFENGGRILKENGCVGTFYVALSFLQSKDPKAVFTSEQLLTAVSQGHELGCHTYGHIHLSSEKPADSIRDIQHNQEALMEVIPNMEMENFSYPFGEQTRTIKKFMSTRFRSARGVTHGLNVRKADLYNLRAIRLYEQTNSLEEISRIIDQAEKRNVWLIFYTHDVSENPSRHGCSPAYFESVVKECINRRFRVLNIRETLCLLQNGKAGKNKG